MWTRLQWALHKWVRLEAGHRACPAVAITDRRSVKTTERGGPRGFDGYKRVKDSERYILVGTLGLPFASRIGPAKTSDWVAGFRLVGGLRFAFPDLRTIVADAGHASRKFACALKHRNGYDLQIVKQRQRAFRIMRLTWIVKRSIAWLDRNRRLAKDYEYRVQSSETMIDPAAIRLILNHLTRA